MERDLPGNKPTTALGPLKASRAERSAHSAEKKQPCSEAHI